MAHAKLQRLGVLYGLTLLVLVGLVGATAYIARMRVEVRGLVTHTHEVRTQIERCRALLAWIDDASQEALLAGGGPSQRTYEQTVETLERELKKLRVLTADNSTQRERLGRIGALLETTVAKEREMVRQMVPHRPTREIERALAQAHAASTRKIVPEFEAMSEVEGYLLADRTAGLDRYSTLTNLLLCALSGSTLLGFLMLGMVSRRQYRSEHKAHERVRTVLESIGDTHFMLDAEWRFTYVNGVMERRIRKPAQAILGKRFWEEFPEALGTEIERGYRTTMETGQSQEFEVFYPPTGMWYSIRVFPAHDGGISVFSRDVTEAKEAARRLRESESHFRAAVEGSMDAFFLFRSRRNAEGHLEDLEVVDANTVAERMLRMPRTTLLGRGLRELLNKGVIGVGFEEYVRSVELRERLEREYELRGETRRWIRQQIVPVDDGLAVFCHDVSEQHLDALALVQANDRLEDLASTDALTGARNRGFFERHFAHSLEVSANAGVPVSLLMLDVDHFKQYNDTYGHPAGDEVLRDLVKVLRLALRGRDVVARYGGEEFVIVMPGAARAAAIATAERVRQEVETYAWRHRPITVSVGIATTEGAATPEDVLDQADGALYAAKHGGRNQVRHADAVMRAA